MVLNSFEKGCNVFIPIKQIYQRIGVTNYSNPIHLLTFFGIGAHLLPILLYLKTGGLERSFVVLTLIKGSLFAVPSMYG
jgi:hypothetical protein